ncbi:MAG: aldehyde dehydrogenase family protein [Candidatus Omnitrophica bacterium]|nr:aldehyde dehydrogenase family protein [Candidatus Omnitrophota bacterium]
MNIFPYYIDGEARRSGQEKEIRNPASGEVFARCWHARPEDVKDAVIAGRRASAEWGEATFQERAILLREIARVLREHVHELAELESREIGKLLKESLFVDIPLAAEVFEYYASFLETLEQKTMESAFGREEVLFDPYGVCGIFLPYNVPLMIFGYSAAAALAAGNAVILKPSEYGQLSVLRLMGLIRSFDMPRGLVQVVTGEGGVIGDCLSRSEVDLISFTGSRKTAQRIIRNSADAPKKIMCELGGANVTAVWEDANQDAAVQNLLASSFLKQGQICIGTSIALIEEKIYDRFIEEFCRRIDLIPQGDPFLPETGLGPLPSSEYAAAVDRRVRECLRRHGGRLLRGGVWEKESGLVYPPTVIEVPHVVYEEFFAPVVLVKRCSRQEIEPAIQANPSGLVLQLWTADAGRARCIARRARYGTVWINTFAQMNAQTPFGGQRTSGWGRNLGKAGFFEYVQLKHIGYGRQSSPVEGWFGV